MTVHLPTIKQLQYLVSLKQHGHFGRAAEVAVLLERHQILKLLDRRQVHSHR